MISSKTITALCLGATLCTAQTINISGIVQDSGGVGIVGATVKLEKANLSATSGAGGVFTLTGSASAKPFTTLRAMAANPVQFRNGKIAFTLSGNTPVGISFHDVGGRQMFSNKRTLGSGTHTISVPMQTAGIFLCKITIGHESYAFKASSFEASSTQQGVVTRGTSALAKQAKATAVIGDVIAATKAGWLNYRCVIGNSDTSGVVIKMLANAGDVTDADGNVYQSVRIGNQVWMVENLRVTKYNDGSAIPLDTSTTSWANATTPEYCYHENTTNADSIKKYGALYNWYVVSPTNAKKIAPAGWHVPSDAEWDTLQNYLIAAGYNWDGTTAGNKIAKALAAKTDWYANSTNGTIGSDLSKNNSSGFSALPGGSRSSFGFFSRQSSYGSWWGATEYDASYAYYQRLDYGYETLHWDIYNKQNGFSVRLLRDLTGNGKPRGFVPRGTFSKGYQAMYANERERIVAGLFQAYFVARRNKRNTINALAFEKDFEHNIFELADEILEDRYRIRPSICFIVNRPVKREIFAADFRDRVVHHFIYNYIYPLFDKLFINDAYSCRVECSSRLRSPVHHSSAMVR